MIKFTAQQPNGRALVGIALTFDELRQIHDRPGLMATIDGSELGLSFDVGVFTGSNDQEILRKLSDKFAEQTDVSFSSRTLDS